MPSHERRRNDRLQDRTRTTSTTEIAAHCRLQRIALQPNVIDNSASLPAGGVAPHAARQRAIATAPVTRYGRLMSFTLPAALMIASGSVHAVVNAIVKGRGNQKNTDAVGARMAVRASTDGVSAVILLPAIMFVPLPAGAWVWLGASAAVHLVYLYAMIRTYALADYSAAYPVMRGSAPLLTAAVSIGFLGERSSALGLIGIMLVGGSMLAMVIGRHLDRTALGWAVLTGGMTALYTIADAHGVRAAPNVASYIVWDFVLIGSESVILFAVLTRGRLFADLAAQWKPGVSAGSLSIVTYGLALAALSLGPTAPLAALRETGMVTALVIAAAFLGEHVSARRVFAVIGIVVGAGVILLA